MFAVLQDLAFQQFELSGDGVGVVVVEAAALVIHVQSHRDIQAVAQRPIQHLLAAVTPIVRAPGAKGIAAMFPELLRRAPFDARALDVEGLVVDEQLVASTRIADLDFCWRAGLGRLSGAIGAECVRLNGHREGQSAHSSKGRLNAERAFHGFASGIALANAVRGVSSRNRVASSSSSDLPLVSGIQIRTKTSAAAAMSP